MTVWFVLAAAAGGVVRHGFNQMRWGWRSTVAANVLGSFLLGWLLAGDPSGSVATVLGTGFCGSLTTFSTFALEVGMTHRRQRATIVAVMIGGCALAVTIGHHLGR